MATSLFPRAAWLALAVTAGNTTPAEAGGKTPGKNAQVEHSESETAEHPYVGMWVTDDGYVRHELLASGRYDEARGTRESAYRGRYEITGTHIEYWDDTGFTADGNFVDRDTLHHGGMILRRR